jgi:inhibitor of cysteine peptidase
VGHPALAIARAGMDDHIEGGGSMRRFVVISLIMIVLAACTSGGDATVTGEDANRTVVVDVGVSAIVELPANPSTGYTWEIVEIDRAVLSPAGEPVFESDSPSLVGAPGLLCFTLEAMEPGTTDVRFVYHRPWEDVEPIDEFTVTIEVR